MKELYPITVSTSLNPNSKFFNSSGHSDDCDAGAIPDEFEDAFDDHDQSDSVPAEGHDDESDEESKGVQEQHIKDFARELYEMVTLDMLKEAALAKLLKIFHALIEKAGFHEEFRNVPASVYLVEKWAMSDTEPLYSVLLDICPTRDHYVFPATSQEVKCPKCGVKRTQKRQMMHGGWH